MGLARSATYLAWALAMFHQVYGAVFFHPTDIMRLFHPTVIYAALHLFQEMKLQM